MITFKLTANDKDFTRIEIVRFEVKFGDEREDILGLVLRGEGHREGKFYFSPASGVEISEQHLEEILNHIRVLNNPSLVHEYQ